LLQGANCAILFAGKGHHLFTARDGGQCRFFFVSAITGELLLENPGSFLHPIDILSLPMYTENILSAYVEVVRQGKGPVMEGSKTEVEGLLKEVDDLQKRTGEMELRFKKEVEDPKGKAGGMENELKNELQIQPVQQ
jgi:hypothetical protein